MHRLEHKHQVEALSGLTKHPGWEYLRHRILGAPGQEGCLLEDLRVEQENCLRGNDLNGARYHQGKIDMLRELFKGELITSWLEEIM